MISVNSIARPRFVRGLVFFVGLASAVSAASPSAFTSTRHADSADSRGLYRVRIHQLAGANAVRGKVVYAVRDARNQTFSDDQVLRRDAAGDWVADIPGQPVQSTVAYHFVMSASTGGAIRHPADPGAEYRFRVSGLIVVSVTVPRPDAANGIAILDVRAVLQPAGDLVCRIWSTGGSAERRVPLSVSRQTDPSEGPADYRLTAQPPPLNPGELADVYFAIRTGDGEVITAPREAPALAYVIKRSLRPVEHFPAQEEYVLGLAATVDRRWMALKGGGVVRSGPNGVSRTWGLAEGLPSGIARFVLPDEATGRSYIGTNRGLAAIEPGDAAIAQISYANLVTTPATEPDRMDLRAGPGLISSLDGTVMFQLQKDPPLGRVPARVFELRDGHLQSWRPTLLGKTLAGLSTASFDDVDGCSLLGAFLESNEAEPQPAIVRRCGQTNNVYPLREIAAASPETILHPIVPKRVLSLAREPVSGNVAFALAYENPGDRRHREKFGIYHLDLPSRFIAPLTPAATDLGAEVTALAADWEGGRLLIATFGSGVLQCSGGALIRMDQASLPAEITAIAPSLIGTPSGMYSGHVRLKPLDQGTVPGDAWPADIDSATGRVLLSSYSQGLDQLERIRGRWQVIASHRPGHELPEGNFGDAQYGETGSVYVALPSRGLLHVGKESGNLLGTSQGLHGNDILRLLASGLAGLWVSYTPLPFGSDSGAAIQVLENDRVIKTIPVPDRDVATIGRWVDVPERKSVFAATAGGIVEFKPDGTYARLSINAASSISRDPVTGSIGTVGTAVERWDGRQFVPVLFALDYPGYPKGRFPTGSPFDLAIDNTGTWYLLYSNGVLAVLDSAGNLEGVLGPEDGIPVSARKLLADPRSGDILIGSGQEGLVVVQRPAVPGGPRHR